MTRQLELREPANLDLRSGVLFFFCFGEEERAKGK